MLRLTDCLQWTSGKIINLDQLEQFSKENCSFDSIGTDTRKSLENNLFIALAGENYDAHQFLQQAMNQNAAGIMVHHWPAGLVASVPVILVKDTLKALQELAQGYRKTLNCKVVGITGSNGKTSTKEFAAAILKNHFKTHWNEGSFNNHWGVPFNLLGIPSDVEVALVEMGMNHLGEIERLVEIALPDLVVCTMVGTAHIENLGTIEKIAEAKAEIYRYSPQARRIFNLDQSHTLQMKKEFFRSNDMTFSENDSQADIYCRIELLTEDSLRVKGKIGEVFGEARIPVFGKQNLTNLMAASAIALACGMNGAEIWKALPLCKTAWGRNQFWKLKNDSQLLFDAYNANPDSMKALLENLSLMKEKRLLGVFGQMRELGDISEIAHQEIGEIVGTLPFEKIYFIGEDHEAFIRGVKKSHPQKLVVSAPDFDEKIHQNFMESLLPDHLVVMKASRGTRLERFLSEDLIDPKLFKKS